MSTSLRDVVKSYGPVRVLDIERLDLARGQIVGVVGENGAGKSTLMGVLAGTVTPDSGTIESDRVAMVSQEFPLVGQLSVAENLLLGTRPSRGFVLDRKAVRRQAQELLDETGVRVPLDVPVGTLPVPARQLIEIAKAWGRRPQLLILDEPTSSLGPVESERVLDLARRHAAGGGTVLFIGHRLDEVRAIADRIIVLRNGKLVADLTPEEATEERLIREMVGAELAKVDVEPPPTSARRVVLSVSDLTADGLGPVDLDVYAGEVVGVAGLMGSGRSRLLHTIAGAQPRTGGAMELDGEPYDPRHPADAVRAGVALVPEDRKEQSLLVAASVRHNVTLPLVRTLGRAGFLSPRRDRLTAMKIVTESKVRCQSVEQPIGSLSGGNQQRAIFGRWLAVGPRLLLLDEPTRGVDVGAKAEIYRLVDDAVRAGMAVLVASSELEELLWMCHRIVVLNRGRISASLPRAEFGKERIMTAAT